MGDAQGCECEDSLWIYEVERSQGQSQEDRFDDVENFWGYFLSMNSMNAAMESGWTLSPLWLAAIVLIGIEECGLARLKKRMPGSRFRSWRRRGVLYDFGIALVCLVDSSPLMGTSMKYLGLHMVIHVVEMFYVPIILILGAPWVPALFALPVGPRRSFLRWWNFGPLRNVTTRITGFITAPFVALVLFNGTMIFWHLPKFYNWASWNPWVHTWLMGPSFVIVGYLFWRIILGSHPVGPRGTTKFQVLSVVVTAFEMLVLAMALSIFSHGAWYSMNIEMLGATQAFHDQQVAAGILWICGDFWTIPALVIITRRLIRENGSVEQAFERALGRL